MIGLWEVCYVVEFFGMLILVLLGNGVVVNVFLKNMIGNDDLGFVNGGWFLVVLGYGFGVMFLVMMFGLIFGNYLNFVIMIG